MLYDQYFIDDLKERAALVRRLLVLATCVLAFVVISGAQEESEAVLVDEFGLVQCGDLQARIDSFLSELNANPSAVGYAVLFNDKRRVTSYANIIRANVYFRGFDPERIKILIGDLSTETGGQLWRSHSKSDIPLLKDVMVPEYDLSAPFVYGSEDENGVCPTFVPELYAKLLKKVPDAWGKIEVFGENSSSRRLFVDMWLKRFENDFGLSRNRIDVVSRWKDGITYANFWFVPAKTR